MATLHCLLGVSSRLDSLWVALTLDRMDGRSQGHTNDWQGKSLFQQATSCMCHDQNCGNMSCHGIRPFALLKQSKGGLPLPKGRGVGQIIDRKTTEIMFAAKFIFLSFFCRLFLPDFSKWRRLRPSRGTCAIETCF